MHAEGIGAHAIGRDELTHVHPLFAEEAGRATAMAYALRGDAPLPAYGPGTLPKSEKIASELLTLPMHPELSEGTCRTSSKPPEKSPQRIAVSTRGAAVKVLLFDRDGQVRLEEAPIPRCLRTGEVLIEVGACWHLRIGPASRADQIAGGDSRGRSSPATRLPASWRRLARASVEYRPAITSPSTRCSPAAYARPA